VNNSYNSNTVVKQDFAVVKQVDGRAAHMTDTTRHQSWKSTPLPDHAGSIPVNSTSAAPEHRVIFMYPYIIKLCGEKALIETKPQ
jgi:hypothetical protein